ncbi:isoleucine-tRNA ligase [Tulasnella sp. 403]|nr:isoleucine-tRNA ligase [Tulasnella sp. 403]
MGHALNKILKDIINRFQVLQGRLVNYIPGWDCHGLPIENKALSELGTGHQDLDPVKLRKSAREVALHNMELQMEEFKQFGIMADWTQQGIYRTMDHEYEIRQLRVFQELVRKGLIYRHYRPVYWSPSSRSALAEAELEYVENHTSFTVYVKFPVQTGEMSSALRDALQKAGVEEDEPVHLAIWTTTPWTLPANMAIGVNPELEYTLVRRSDGVVIVARERLESLAKFINDPDVIGVVSGQDIVGTGYSHIFRPQKGRVPRVVPWSYVSSATGTGLVHMAPAHGAEDYSALKAIGLFNEVAIPCPVDEDGKFTTELRQLAQDPGIADQLVGLPVQSEGSKTIVGILKSTGVLLAEEKLKHRYPYDWKTKKPIITRATAQWFASVDDIKEASTQSLNDVHFYPEVSRSRLESFVRERSEWCISRQRVWGVPIPALYDSETDEAILTTSSLDHIIAILEKKGVDYWFEGPVEEFISNDLQKNGRNYVKRNDTVDVWFDSGTSWSLIEDLLPSQSGPHRREYLTDVCLEGSDQHRGWFQSLLLTAVSAAKDGPKSPYKNLITHGFVLDDKGKKMSKSLGNVISPLSVINGGEDKKKMPAHGADILRLWAASVDYGKDVSIGPRVLAQTSEAYRKLRNTLRFLLANLQDGAALSGSFVPVQQSEISLVDRYVMHQLYELEITCKDAYENFNFPKVATSVYHFATTTLSSLYFDVTKDSLYADSANEPRRQAIVTVLGQVLQTLVPILAPITPHLSEEVHEVLVKKTGASPLLSVFASGWRSVDPSWLDSQVARKMQSLMAVRSAVTEALEDARRQKHIGSSLEAEVEIIFPSTSAAPVCQVLKEEADFLKTLFIVSNVRLGRQADPTPQKWHAVRELQADPSTTITFRSGNILRFNVGLAPSRGVWRSIPPELRQVRHASFISNSFFTSSKPPKSKRIWLLLPASALVAFYSYPKQSSPVPILLASPEIIPTSTRRNTSPSFDDGHVISSPNEPHWPILARIMEFIRCRILEPLSTGLRFTQLLLYFLPVIVTCPMLIVGHPDAAHNGERWGAIWWYGLLTKQMQHAGPTFIKLAQWAASRVDIFPQELCDRLGALHSTTKPHALYYTKRLIEKVFQRPFDEVFEKFDETPIGSGAIAQVYRATLRKDVIPPSYLDPKRKPSKKRTIAADAVTPPPPPPFVPTACVAVKVLHPRVDKMIIRDLRIMNFFAKCIAALPGLEWISLPEEVDVFGKMMKEQLNLQNEAHNLRIFERNFNGRRENAVNFPRPLEEYSSKDILIEEFEDALPLNAFLRNGGGPYDCVLATLGLDVFLNMLLLDNFVHSDLHPGNIMVKFYKPSTSFILQNMWASLTGAAKPKDPLLVNQEASDISDAVVGRLRPLRYSRKEWLQELDALSKEGYQPELVLLDAGLVTELDSTNRRNFIDLFRAIAEFDGYRAGRLMIERCRSPGLVIDREVFALRIQHLALSIKAKTFSLGQIKIADVLTEVLKAVQSHHVKMEGDFVNTIISILLLEGIGRQLDPDMDLFKSALPVLRKLSRQMSPKDVAENRANLGTMLKASLWFFWVWIEARELAHSAFETADDFVRYDWLTPNI